MAFIIHEKDAPTELMRLDRGIQHRLVNPDTGSEHIDVHINTLRVGSGEGPYHYHSNAENIYYVLEGTAKVTIEDVDHIVGPGVAVFIPAGERHDCMNAGDVDLRVMEIKVPHHSDFILTPREG